MRWLKHLTTFTQDKDVDLILERCGAIGYGAYWLIIEHLGESTPPGSRPSLALTDREWAHVARVPPRVWIAVKPFLGRVLKIESGHPSRTVRITASLKIYAEVADWQKRRYVRMAVAGRVTRALRDWIFERDGYQCRSCGGGHLLTIDHVTPISKGGMSTRDNLQTLCRGCNCRKGARLEAK